MPRGFLGVASAVAAVAVALGSGQASAGSAAGSQRPEAAPALVKVIPPDAPDVTPTEELDVAGSTGFLHQFDGGPQYLWTEYANGQTVSVPRLAGAVQIQSAGDDLLRFLTPPPAEKIAGDAAEFDLATMTWRQFVLPAGQFAEAEFGDSVISVKEGTTPSLDVLNYAPDGTPAAVPVTGLPAGAHLRPTFEWTGDTTDVVLPYTAGTGNSYVLLDLATGVLTPIADPDLDFQQVMLTPTTVALYDSTTGVVRAYSRADLGAAPRTVTVPVAGDSVALAGDQVIGVRLSATCGPSCPVPVGPATDAPLSGAAAGEALPVAEEIGPGLIQAADGSALIVGGTGVSDFAVRKLNVDGADNLTDTRVLPLTGPVTSGGLTISQGLVRHIEVEPALDDPPLYLLFNHALDANSSGFAWPARIRVNGGTLATPLTCASSATCQDRQTPALRSADASPQTAVRSADGNWYGTSYLSPGTRPGTIDLREQWESDASTMSLALPSASGRIVDASPDYVVVDGTDPAHQYLVDVGQEKIEVTRPVTGAALWYDTLWSAAGAGLLGSKNLITHVTGKPISTGAKCVASEIQATLRWIYWSCGPAGPAGVYDLRRHLDIAVPAGPVLLGDGYLVSQDPGTGDLILHDVHAGKLASPVTLATDVSAAKAADSRNITWAVDKYSGDVAYVRSDDSVAVIGTGVPATGPAIGSPAQLSPALMGFGTNESWSAGLGLTRPVTSWQVTIRQASTGQVVHTRSGGPARLGIFVGWGGRLASGVRAFSGRYDWTLAVTPAGSASQVKAGGGVLIVECGRLPFRSYDCSGVPALLAVTGSGHGHWFNGTDSGGLRDNGYTDNWLLGRHGRFATSAIVPFGDFNGDGFGDLLARDGTGVLRAYLGIGQSYFNSQSAKTIKIAGDWSGYTALVDPGDLTGDGHDDLLARDARGRLWLYAGTGHGAFRKRVPVGSGWGRFSRLIGAGDLTGDGIGDVLAVDSRGVMWRFDGTGQGGLRRAVRVGPGWRRYNTIIGIGDLNNDGRDDLVARDTAGRLWFYAGNGRGGFARRTLISTGWQRFKALF